MGKVKSHKATAKRFTVTKSGKVKMSHQGRRHKLGKKDTKRKRILRKAGYISEANAANIKKIIPYA
ncbi:MAG: 50S ribosomal protein L35 [Ruminococcaceae bacterium]|nr:50S ribosomal protein L35 [Oscillospiraceae bacterium]MBQ2686992.1 50S ribosomal protein L35 [Clostridia bacterium]